MKYGFDFENNKNEKIGKLRKFVKNEKEKENFNLENFQKEDKFTFDENISKINFFYIEFGPSRKSILREQILKMLKCLKAKF